MLKIIYFLIFIKFSENQNISPDLDIKTLTELPLEKLLKVQKSFSITEKSGFQSAAEDDTKPLALALQGKTKLNDRGGHDSLEYDEHSYNKPSKYESIFQVSITSLAFLAFGGYLLCLLVQALKGKHMDMPTTTETIAALIQAINRRRTTRRPQRYQRPNRPNNNYTSNRNGKPRPREKRDVWSEGEWEKMYYALIGLSEAYTTYHTVDFSKVNNTYFQQHYF